MDAIFKSINLRENLALVLQNIRIDLFWVICKFFVLYVVTSFSVLDEVKQSAQKLPHLMKSIELANTFGWGVERLVH